MPTLETKSISKRFDSIKAVDNVSLSFEAGKITGLIGPNGSGKSTLINLLTGFVPYDAGMLVLGETTRLSRVRPYDIATYDITRTFQDVRLFEQMSVLDNVLVVLTERNVWSALFEKHKTYHLEKAKEVLERVGLWEKRNQLAVNLSYGQRKLLEIARAVAMDANIYFFDEPFAGLFPEMRKVVTSVLKELRNKGNTVILVEHNMDIIRELSDYCVVMDSGSLLAQGKPEVVLSRKDVIEAYLGE
ncbi:ABC transporter ATP-binding protein [Candidatus Kaiserbacteria bacterium]|nr:ABC transporter ATP-binding protein [Candidatus Kaiserbacteria bacterium]